MYQMLKYISTDIVFQEVPDEVSLVISITGCPIHCPDCHSKYLWENIGEELNKDSIDKNISKYLDNITCICFMGGDNDKQSVYCLAKYIKDTYPSLKTAWYSGSREIDTDFPWKDFDYVKIGPYIKKYGGLDFPDTNQYMLKKIKAGDKTVWEDITYVFYKNKHPERF